MDPLVFEPFQVVGHRPVTQWGTKPVVTGAGTVRHVTSGGQDLAVWRDHVAWRARQIVGARPPLDCPVSIEIEFRFVAPKSRQARVAESGRLPYFVKNRDDIDKLVRAVLDGLTEGGLLADDGVVYRITASKWEYPASAPEGCGITVRRWTGLPMAVPA